ncbi:hypothetical protein GCM10009647_035850 [Streptomyces sanglieri]
MPRASASGSPRPTATYARPSTCWPPSRELGEHFECSQTKVSKAIAQLTRHNFTWKEKRGLYRLNPLYAYGWGSDNQRVLVVSLQKDLLAHQIEIPTVRKKETS